MKKMNQFFKSPKNTALSIVAILGVLVLIGAGTAISASAIAESSSIGTDNAQKFAFADAGIDPNAARILHTEFDYEMGQFVYEVEFIHEGTEYEYWINASDGTVLKKTIEIVDRAKAEAAQKADQAVEAPVAGGVTEVTSVPEATTQAPTQTTPEITSSTEKPAETKPAQTTTSTQKPAETKPAQSTYIGLDKAKSIAVAKAGFSVSQVTFQKAKLERDDGVMEYEIEFYKNGVEYDVTINATTGAIIEYDVDRDDYDDDRYDHYDDDHDDHDDDDDDRWDD